MLSSVIIFAFFQPLELTEAGGLDAGLLAVAAPAQVGEEAAGLGDAGRPPAERHVGLGLEVEQQLQLLAQQPAVEQVRRAQLVPAEAVLVEQAVLERGVVRLGARKSNTGVAGQCGC